jgi:hypothetical protein
MKNKLTIITALFLLMAVGFGCNWSFGSSSSSSDEKGKANSSSPSSPSSENSNALAKTGVAECDEFIDMISNESKSADENFVTRKLREAATDYAKEEIRKNLEENKGDKEKIALGCREAKTEYLKDKQEKEAAK